jgi:hypothetical protein
MCAVEGFVPEGEKSQVSGFEFQAALELETERPSEKP